MNELWWELTPWCLLLFVTLFDSWVIYRMERDRWL